MLTRWKKLQWLLLLMIMVLAGVMVGPSLADAAVAVLNAWPAAPQLTATTGNLSGTFNISAGSNRLLVIAVDCYDDDGDSGQTFTATYNGQSLTQAYIQNTDRRQTWIGYLKESNLPASGSHAVAVTITGSHSDAAAYIASYSGVDQTTPKTDSGGKYINNTNNVTIANTALNVNAGGYGIFTFAGTNGRGYTSDNESYTENADTNSGGMRSGICSKAFASTTTTNPTVTWSGNNRVSVSLITLNPSPTPPTVTLGLTGSPMAEAGGASTVTATLSKTYTEAVTVNLAFSGTATLTNDYTRSGTSIVIAAGDTTGTVTLTAVQDLLDENDETIIVDIDTVTNGTESGAQQVTATITDDDAAPTVTLGLTGSPMAEAAGVGTVTATLSAVSGLPVTVNLGYTGTAALTDDYTRSGVSILIAAGSTTGTVTLTAVQDAIDEADETIITDIDTVTNGTESGTQQVTATITDDDAAPTVTLGLTGSPMAEAAGVGTVTATLSAVSGLPVTVDLGYTGTATLTADYTRSGTSIVIAAGSTTGTVTLTAVQDLLDEANETVIVDIDAVTNGTESGAQQVTATITDDDAAPSLSINDVTAAEGNAGTMNFDFTVTLSTASGTTVTVDYATSNGTATTADSDYVADSGVLTFNPGDLTKTVTAVVNGDTECEMDETFTVGLSNPANATISDNQGQGTITNDDTGPASCAITAPESVIFGSTGNTASTAATPGATYAWVLYVDGILSNGLITAGQNSPQITWTAPVSFTVIDIGVTVTTEGGCVCENDPPVAGGDGGVTVSGNRGGSIPTLSEWGMIILGLFMAGSAMWVIRKRQSV